MWNYENTEKNNISTMTIRYQEPLYMELPRPHNWSNRNNDNDQNKNDGMIESIVKSVIDQRRKCCLFFTINILSKL